MTNGNVGAGILNIITESLYDKPIVVFREYVQNSVDSFRKTKTYVNSNNLISKIWIESKNLYFLDNGNGISKNSFFDKMNKIAYSEKKRTRNIGYKGIGRLSGLPYCDKLIFINICSYSGSHFQKYCVDGIKYKQLKEQLNDYDFKDLMDKIGTYNETVEGEELANLKIILDPYKELFANYDTGFLVILENINKILEEITRKDGFNKELGWLLPVKFKDDLLNSNEELLFKDIIEPLPDLDIIPAQAFNISFNNNPIERPIDSNMLRDYTCKINFKYGVGFHSFYHDKINVTKGNEFCGIKLYLDNILLCDESEIIPVLHRYGLIKHTVLDMIQSVKGMGAIIYITDKVNISANARRTFIEVTDDDAYEFLEYLAEFVDNIYNARYALSKYSNGKSSMEQTQENLEGLRKAAELALQILAREEILIESEDNTPKEINDLGDAEKKNLIKKKLTRYMNLRIKEFLLQTSVFEYENVTTDFITWLLSNDKL